VDKVADRLPGWKAALMHPAGRATLVKAVLTAVPVYHFIALQCSKWVIKAIDKIRRGFLWKRRKDIKGGHCLMNWNQVCRPLELGGLAIHNLESLGWVLDMRWLWLKKTQPDRPWSGLDIQVHPNVAAMFAISVVTSVGNGESTLLDRQMAARGLRGPIGSGSLPAHPKEGFKERTVKDALLNS
jgi:hypothetical protein